MQKKSQQYILIFGHFITLRNTIPFLNTLYAYQKDNKIGTSFNKVKNVFKKNCMLEHKNK